MSNIALLKYLQGLSDITRLRILFLTQYAYENGIDITVSDIAKVMSRVQPVVQRHVRCLYDSGLIEYTVFKQYKFLKPVSSLLVAFVLSKIDFGEDKFKDDISNLIQYNINRKQNDNSKTKCS